MTTKRRLLLASIAYRQGTGDALDGLLNAIASRLQQSEHAIAGAIKHSVLRPERCRCDMILENLHTGEFIPISQDRGAEARGCVLDASALEGVVGSTLSGLEDGARFLVVNRFGKQEVDGRGFRPAIEFAACHRVPCLVGVEQDNLSMWRAFAGDLHEELPSNLERVWDWCLGALSQGDPQSQRVGHGERKLFA